MSKRTPPFTGSPPNEVPLKHAPLVRVLAQVRFNPILSIEDKLKVAAVQEKLRSFYPILEEENTEHVLISPKGPQINVDKIWRFYSSDLRWRVSLNTNFIALETNLYSSRTDFLSRLQNVLTAVGAVFSPPHATRIGFRYLDQIEGKGFGKLSELIKPEVLGIAKSDLGKAAEHIFTQAVFEADEGKLTTRWGNLPAGQTHDPDVLEPIKGDSWVLDMDLSSMDARPFNPDELIKTFTAFSQRIYAVFREMITDEFISFYGDQK